MKIEDLNLEFLWNQKEHLDRDHPDHLQFVRFIEEESLDEMIRLLILSYVNEYPGSYWLSALLLSDESLLNIDFEGDYHLLDGQFLKRNDLAAYKWTSRWDLHGEPYMYEFILDFYEKTDLARVVEEALTDKAFFKAIDGNKTLFAVENSPIGAIELSPQSFRLTINAEQCASVHQTPLELDDLKLEWLWADKGGPIMDAPDPFWEKWDGELLKYLSFIEHAPLDQVIEVLLISFKDRYPRDYWKTVFLSDFESVKKIKEEGLYCVSENQHINREDIVRIKRKIREDIHGFEYDFERIFEFKDDIDLIPVVEKTLSANTYTQTTTGARTIYILKNSPIARIELHRRRFKMVVNPEYYVKRRP